MAKMGCRLNVVLTTSDILHVNPVKWVVFWGDSGQLGIKFV